MTLPEGVSLSPSAADGLAGCEESGPEGIELGNHDTLGHEVQEGEELGPDELPHPAPGHCPAASQIGTVEVLTPLLSSPLQGHVYVAQPKCGGEGQPACTQASATNGELFGLYLEAAGSGVIVKLKGTVSADPATGRLTTSFSENPQLPFSELKLRLNGGPRAPLANPQSCGEAQTTSVLEPWSAPESGSPATPFSTFTIGGCQSPEPFSPAFSAGTVRPTAGAFSPFTLSFSRSDGQQDLSDITVSTPPGLLGELSAVSLCPEPQASQGACGPPSLIGHTTVAAGAGSHPFYLSGSVYLTGAYKGAPFGLSIVVPERAGPFNLGERSGQGRDQRRPVQLGADGHLRPAAPAQGWRAVPPEKHQRDDRPPELHVQPDQLLGAADRGHDRWRHAEWQHGLQLPGGEPVRRGRL